MLLNYTRTGKAFWNRESPDTLRFGSSAQQLTVVFNLIPLRNSKGEVDYFVGAQVDVSTGSNRS
jgi:hypothetical protein